MQDLGEHGYLLPAGAALPFTGPKKLGCANVWSFRSVCDVRDGCLASKGANLRTKSCGEVGAVLRSRRVRVYAPSSPHTETSLIAMVFLSREGEKEEMVLHEWLILA